MLETLWYLSSRLDSSCEQNRSRCQIHIVDDGSRNRVPHCLFLALLLQREGRVQARISASAIMLEHAESAFHHQNEAQQKFEINPQVRGRLLNCLSIHAQAREFLGRTPAERVKALAGRFECMTDELLLFVFPLLDYKSLMNLLWTCKAFRDFEAEEPTNKASYHGYFSSTQSFHSILKSLMRSWTWISVGYGNLRAFTIGRYTIMEVIKLQRLFSAIGSSTC